MFVLVPRINNRRNPLLLNKQNVLIIGRGEPNKAKIISNFRNNNLDTKFLSSNINLNNKYQMFVNSEFRNLSPIKFTINQQYQQNNIFLIFLIPFTMPHFNLAIFSYLEEFADPWRSYSMVSFFIFVCMSVGFIVGEPYLGIALIVGTIFILVVSGDYHLFFNKTK